jgi:hypothetical protein
MKKFLMFIFLTSVFLPLQLSGAKVTTKKTVYRIVCHPNTNEMNNIVNQLLQSGWKLYGSPTAYGNGSYKEVCQALTKEVEP